MMETSTTFLYFDDRRHIEWYTRIPLLFTGKDHSMVLMDGTVYTIGYRGQIQQPINLKST